MAPNFNSCTSGFFYFPFIKLLKKTLNINFIVTVDIIIYQAFSIKKFIFYSEIIIIQVFTILGATEIKNT